MATPRRRRRQTPFDRAPEFERLARIGHRLRGNAKTYGFDELSDWGTRLETAGEERDGAEARTAFEGISTYVADKSLR